MNNNEMKPLPILSREWFLNRNTITVLLDTVSFLVLYNTYTL